MTSTTPTAAPTAADLDAARLLLDRLGVSPADLLTAAPDRAPAPTFADYIPVVRAAVSPGTRRVYGSYWNRITEHWGTRRLDEPTPTEIQQLAEQLKAGLTVRRNARGGRGATEHLIAALRCLYRHAEADNLIPAGSNPARKVPKPRRLPSTRRAVADTRLAEINRVAATTGRYARSPPPCSRSGPTGSSSAPAGGTVGLAALRRGRPGPRGEPRAASDAGCSPRRSPRSAPPPSGKS
ncbi:MAG TPA: hypothetical protein VNP92_10425 [Actinophytocola sp.]|nr:hypothetical protein [Actinophytocola sp.]